MCENLKLLIGYFGKYISHLAHKRQKTLDSESSGATLTDSIKVLNSVFLQLNDLLDELSTKLKILLQQNVWIDFLTYAN